jgi:hypothetical protein
MERELATFFDTFFGIDLDGADPNKANFPTFEEVLGIIEIALQRGERFRGFGVAANDPRLQQIREHLVFLICDILARALQRPAEHHKALVDFLRRSGNLCKTAFVSFNYDILIDNALADEWRACDLDYGVEFTNFEAEDDWRRPRPTRSVGLFKLHGSLNWLYCPTCTALTLTPKKKPRLENLWVTLVFWTHGRSHWKCR